MNDRPLLVLPFNISLNDLLWRGAVLNFHTRPVWIHRFTVVCCEETIHVAMHLYWYFETIWSQKAAFTTIRKFGPCVLRLDLWPQDSWSPTTDFCVDIDRSSPWTRPASSSWTCLVVCWMSVSWCHLTTVLVFVVSLSFFLLSLCLGSVV